MSLSTLAALKTDLVISGTAEDTRLTSLLRNVCGIIRGYLNRYLGGVVSAISLANPTVITAIGHGLETGQSIVVSGSNSTPTIDGERVVTVIDDDTFSVPVNVTVAGTKGQFILKLTEYYCGHDGNSILLHETPVQSVASVNEDAAAYFSDAPGAFAANTLLTSGVDYCLNSRTGILLRVGANWPAANEQLRGLLANGRMPGLGNVKVIYTAGYTRMPTDIVSAAHQLVAEHRRSADAGGAMQSESLDYYTYQKMSPADQANCVGSVKSILAQYSPWVF